MQPEQSTSEPSTRSTPRSPRDEALSRPLPPRVAWEELGPDFFTAWGYPDGKFKPQHLAIYGPTGRGKSFFEAYILAERARLRGSRVVVIATKPADKTLMRLGWPIVQSWPPAQGWTKDKRRYNQVIYWVKAPRLDEESQARQSQKIRDLLQQLWVPDSNIVVVFDEIAYVEQELKLGVLTARYFREGRGLGITVVASTQRPAYVSRTMHSETDWAVFFAPKDEEDLERLAQIAGNKLYYKRVLASLNAAKYEFLLVHALTGESVISSLPKNPKPIVVSRPVQELPKTRQPMA